MAAAAGALSAAAWSHARALKPAQQHEADLPQDDEQESEASYMFEVGESDEAAVLVRLHGAIADDAHETAKAVAMAVQSMSMLGVLDSAQG